MWLKWINIPLATKVFPYLESHTISTFGCFSPSCQYDCLCCLRKLMCIDLSFDEWKATSFSCGYTGCFCFFSGNCKWLLLMMTDVATKSLSTAGNQLYIGQRGVIRIDLADSFLTLLSTHQLMLKCGKQ